MNNQPKTPGAMVLVPRETVQRVLDDAAYISQLDRQSLHAILDAEQPPAVGGEPEFPKLDNLADLPNAESPAEWDAGYRKVWQDWMVAARNKMQLFTYAKAMQAYVATLLAEIERWKTSCEAAHKVMARQRSHIEGYMSEIAEALDDETLTSIAQVATSIRDLQARIVELEAQQGEPVSYMVISTSNRPEKCTPQDPEGFPVYRQAQPATVKVVLPERRAVSYASREQAMCATAWNACLDEIAKLNPALKTVTPSRKQ